MDDEGILSDDESKNAPSSSSTKKKIKKTSNLRLVKNAGKKSAKNAEKKNTGENQSKKGILGKHFLICLNHLTFETFSCIVIQSV